MGFLNLFRRKKDSSSEPVKSKRMAPRWRISAPAKIKWVGSSDYVPCIVENMNMKGLCLSLAKPIPEGCLGGKLYFNERFFYDIEIIIIWHKENSNQQVYGLRFSRFRESDKEKLFMMIKEDYASHLQDE